MLVWDKLLTPKRFREHHTVPRTKGDNRSPFKRDFDTVCNSTILRRLQDKAQVFPLEEGDYARTRLTHSIEALSIAESLGFQVIETIKNHDEKYIYSEDSDGRDKRNITDAYIQDIPYILRTAALLHDMGNPPFGHLGERIIGDWFSDNLQKLAFNSSKQLVYNAPAEPANTLEYMLKGELAQDLKHFEGNAQLLRLVTKLNMVVDETGMNLSFPVMAAFIKYPTSSTQINPSSLLKKKIGYFTAEKDLFSRIEDELGLNGSRHPLAYLLEAADDIAYLTADIEDAHKKGLISLHRIHEYLSENADDEIVRKTIDVICEYTDVAKKMGYSDIDDYVIHRLRIYIKGIMIDSMSTAFEQAYEKIMCGEFNNELIEVSTVACIARILRRIERENIYYCSSILETKTSANAVITKLLETYVPAIVNWSEADKDTDSSNNLLYLSLSQNYRYICETANRRYLVDGNYPDERLPLVVYNKILLVTDQISGMTDSHALSVYKTITAN